MNWIDKLYWGILFVAAVIVALEYAFNLDTYYASPIILTNIVWYLMVLRKKKELKK